MVTTQVNYSRNFNKRWYPVCRPRHIGCFARTSNYIPQYLWYEITCPCPWYLLLTQTPFKWGEISFSDNTYECLWMKYVIVIHRKHGIKKRHIQMPPHGCKGEKMKKKSITQCCVPNTTSPLCDFVNRFIWTTQMRRDEEHNITISSEICYPHIIEHDHALTQWISLHMFIIDKHCSPLRVKYGVSNTPYLAFRSGQCLTIINPWAEIHCDAKSDLNICYIAVMLYAI